MSILKAFCLFFLLFLLGCENHHPNPEVLDPIFKEYSAKAQENKKEVETIDKILEASLLELKTDAPTGIRRMGMVADINLLKEERRLYRQKERYFTIKAKKRANYVRKRTIANINIKKNRGLSEVAPWDQNREFELYNINKRLREAPRDWGHRVPKLNPEEDF